MVALVATLKNGHVTLSSFTTTSISVCGVLKWYVRDHPDFPSLTVHSLVVLTGSKEINRDLTLRQL